MDMFESAHDIEPNIVDVTKHSPSFGLSQKACDTHIKVEMKPYLLLRKKEYLSVFKPLV